MSSTCWFHHDPIRRQSGLTDTALASNVLMSPGDLFLARFGIRPEDKTATLLMFSNMFMSSIAIGMIRVCAFTLFLAH